MDRAYISDLRINKDLETKTLKVPYYRNVNRASKEYTFDEVFWDNTSQVEFFENIGKSLVKDVLSGYNNTIFAYGQTGSGKTFTVQGSDKLINGKAENMGLIPRCVYFLYDVLEADKSILQYSVEVSYVEIYLEKLRDLLNPAGSQSLQIRDPLNGETFVANLTHDECNFRDQVLGNHHLGNQHRTTSATMMNASSSRSHSVFTLKVTQQLQSGQLRVSKLNFGDLAGSETQKKAGTRGTGLKEGSAINKSLTVLSQTINALAEGRAHVPYRDSKLTHILRNSLDGNCKTTLVVCATHHAFNRDETISTLNFAQRVKKIKTKAKKNDVFTAEQLQAELKKLKASYKALQERKAARTKINLETTQNNGLDISPSLVIQDTMENVLLLDLQICNETVTLSIDPVMMPDSMPGIKMKKQVVTMQINNKGNPLEIQHNKRLSNEVENIVDGPLGVNSLPSSKLEIGSRSSAPSDWNEATKYQEKGSNEIIELKEKTSSSKDNRIGLDDFLSSDNIVDLVVQTIDSENERKRERLDSSEQFISLDVNSLPSNQRILWKKLQSDLATSEQKVAKIQESILLTEEENEQLRQQNINLAEQINAMMTINQNKERPSVRSAEVYDDLESNVQSLVKQLQDQLNVREKMQKLITQLKQQEKITDKEIKSWNPAPHADDPSLVATRGLSFHVFHPENQETNVAHSKLQDPYNDDRSLLAKNATFPGFRRKNEEPNCSHPAVLKIKEAVEEQLEYLKESKHNSGDIPRGWTMKHSRPKQMLKDSTFKSRTASFWETKEEDDDHLENPLIYIQNLREPIASNSDTELKLGNPTPLLRVYSEEELEIDAKLNIEQISLPLDILSDKTYCVTKSEQGEYILDREMLKPTSKIDVLDINTYNWHSAIVMEKLNDQVKIHYDNCDERYDEWVSKDSIRIQLYSSRAKASEKTSVYGATTYGQLTGIYNPKTNTLIASIVGGDSAVIMEGWMTKQGRYNKNWNRRYFQLKTDHFIQYYRTSDLNKQMGQVNLGKAIEIKRFFSETRKHPYSFMVACETRTWYFECDSMSLMVDWWTVIEATMNHQLETLRISYHQSENIISSPYDDSDKCVSFKSEIEMKEGKQRTTKTFEMEKPSLGDHRSSGSNVAAVFKSILRKK